MSRDGELPEAAYDAWLHWETYSPCNFRCAYCSSEKNPARPIRVGELMRTLEATGRTFRVSFTGGGEPFLVPNLVDTCLTLATGHYISLNTHLTAPQTKRFIDEVPAGRVLEIIASAHLEELSRLGLFDRFFANYHAAKARGFLIRAKAVAYPPVAGKVDEYQRLFESNGVELRFTCYVGQWNGSSYPRGYTDEELRTFGMDERDSGFHLLKGSICNAGYNTAVASPAGDVYGCANSRVEAGGWRALLKHVRRLGHIYTGFQFQPKLIRCPYDVCICPMNLNDMRLFGIAKAERPQDVA